MLSAFIREFLIPLLLFLFLRSILRTLWVNFRRPISRSHPPGAPPPVRTGGQLHRDPVCGTYVSSDTGIVQKSGGETIFFCSPECRDKYRTR